MVFLVDVMVLPINRTENEKNKVGKNQIITTFQFLLLSVRFLSRFR